MGKEKGGKGLLAERIVVVEVGVLTVETKHFL
jgi:hypothetical protein